MPRALVALGSNVGQRAPTLARAIELLCANPEISAVQASTPRETEPVGGPAGQPAFVNSAIAFDTTFSAEQLHAALRAVENALGRKRGQRWGARTIDLDLLLHGDTVVDTPELIVPHPRMAFRRFVLEPAAEVALEMAHPIIGWSIARLLDHLNHSLPYVALLGLPGSGKTALAGRLCDALGGRLVADPAAELRVADQAGAGRGYGVHLELLDRRARSLGRADWPANDLLAVSDFHFDQCLTYAQIELGQRDFDAFRAAWRTARAEVVLPKLLIVLDTPRPWQPAPAGGPPGEANAAGTAARATSSHALGEALMRLTAELGIGPVLYAGREPPAQFEEAAAAIQAMR